MEDIEGVGKSVWVYVRKINNGTQIFGVRLDLSRNIKRIGGTWI